MPSELISVFHLAFYVSFLACLCVFVCVCPRMRVLVWNVCGEACVTQIAPDYTESQTASEDSEMMLDLSAITFPHACCNSS